MQECGKRRRKRGWPKWEGSWGLFKHPVSSCNFAEYFNTYDRVKSISFPQQKLPIPWVNAVIYLIPHSNNKTITKHPLCETVSWPVSKHTIYIYMFEEWSHAIKNMSVTRWRVLSSPHPRGWHSSSDMSRLIRSHSILDLHSIVWFSNLWKLCKWSYFWI